jgi:CheY-like chemotaxis protein
MLGHELRNPLAPIVTALHLMERRGDATSTLRERRIIERQVGHLSRLVDDLLDISRVTEGKLQIEHARVDIAAVVGRAVELMRPVLDARAQPIELQFPEYPLQVMGDAMRLAQVLGNLLSNAAKFTPQDGRISLRVARVDADVELRVQDSGCGIAPELLPHVFEPFVQGEQRLDRRAGGLGLGLAIVQTLVRLHGGSVHAESAGAGAGSLFVVRLPLAEAVPVQPAHEPRPPQVRGPRMRILVVDDNADAAQSLSLLLGEVGHEVRVAGDAAAALASVDAGFDPELALLDIGLPGMDGYELARRLRGVARLRGIRLIALTGYGASLDRSRSLAAGFDDHLVKPIAVERLLEMLQPAGDAPAAAIA